jgi:endonuclease/exonuclease/phosphatase family metal-dependent hydrolase
MGKVCLALSLFGALRVLGFLTDPRLSDAEIHSIVGEGQRIRRAAPAPDDDLKVITWNIERGAAYDEILTVLKAVDADILLLQEVDRDCRRTNHRDIARDLAEALEMNWVSAGEFQELGEGRNGRPAIHGQAILSKFSIEEAEVLRFKAQARWRWSINPVQPRRGGRIALKARSAGLLLYNTHIESGRNERIQRDQIAEIVADHSREVAAHWPVLIGGDFNNGPILRSSMFGYLSAAAFADALGEAAQRGPTSFGQSHPIDWIFVKNLTPVRGQVLNTPAASDHFPVIAALDGSSALPSSP